MNTNALAPSLRYVLNDDPSMAPDVFDAEWVSHHDVPRGTYCDDGFASVALMVTAAPTSVYYHPQCATSPIASLVWLTDAEAREMTDSYGGAHDASMVRQG